MFGFTEGLGAIAMTVSRIELVLFGWLVFGCLFPNGELAPAAEPPPASAGAAEHSDQKKPDAAAEQTMQAVLDWAQRTTTKIETEIHDYSAVFQKREAEDGVLGDPHRMVLKVRHKPLSIYAYFYSPADRRGEEAIYVAGQNGGNLLGHTTGITGALMGTLSLAPEGLIAMEGQHRPLTEIGILNLCRRISQAAEKGVKHGQCRVEVSREKKVDGRACRCLQITNPDDREQFRFSQIRLYIDEQLDLPVRFEAYDWPAAPGEEPLLFEEYTYAKLKLNPGLADQDFDIRNPSYGYVEGRQP